MHGGTLRGRLRSDGSTDPAGPWTPASFREQVWEDFVAAVRYLPHMVADEMAEAGATREIAVAIVIAWGQTELSSLMSVLSVGKTGSPEGEVARAAVASFFDTGVLRLMCEPDMTGFNAQTAFLKVVARECLSTTVRAVFDKSNPTEGGSYVPDIPG